MVEKTIFISYYMSLQELPAAALDMSSPIQQIDFIAEGDVTSSSC
jgi:hypothetical protein